MVKTKEIYKFKLIDYIQSFFNLNNLQTKILEYMLLNKKDYIDITEITENISKDRTNILKSMNRLIDLGLVARTKVKLSKGWKYDYYVVGKDSIINVFTKIVDSHNQTLKEELEEYNLK